MEVHRIFVGDPAQNLFRRAIQATVGQGDVVLDLGTGTGIHALFACRAGARRVYAVDADDVIELAREVVCQNGCRDRVVFVRGFATEIELPEKVDAVVTNQGFTAVLNLLAHARRRFLKPGGTLIPSAVRLVLVPLECPEDFDKRIRFWRRARYGLDFSPLAARAANELHSLNFEPEHFIGEPAPLPPIDLTQELAACLEWRRQFRITRQGFLHGLGVWYEYYLAPGTILSTKPPLRVGSPPWSNVFLPLARAIPVKRGDRLDVKLHLRPAPGSSIWKWSVEIASRRNGRWVPGQRVAHSTFKGLPLGPDALKKLSPDSRPRSSRWGRARLEVLRLCNGRRALGDIEREIYRRHRALFASADEAASFVAEIVLRYSTDRDPSAKV